MAIPIRKRDAGVGTAAGAARRQRGPVSRRGCGAHFVLFLHVPPLVLLAVPLVDGGSMPDASYSALANWDGRLSAPGSINGDDVPSGSRSSSRPPRTSPRVDPAPNGYSHAVVSSAVVAEKDGVMSSPNVAAERTERGAGSASEKVRRRANRLVRSLRGVRDNHRKQEAPPPTLAPEHLGAAPDDSEQPASLRKELPPSCSQALPISPQKPMSRASHQALHSPTRDKRDHSRPRPPPHDDDADSLMDADGETDHESEASVYPIQNAVESPTATANVSS
uniref:Thioredoxin reductase (EC) n=1 Tax=Ganoderma boninense TaxID=34458 RepID=A0A5K1K865_9APHY|nr:Thioredoxin reductase (EC [Ganoderma boninense]